MTLLQTELNMVAVCQEVLRWADRHNVPEDEPGFTPRHRLQRIAIMTVMTESGGHMYANPNVARSMQLPHDALGTDHHSVGLFQQQTGSDGSNAFGWGTVEECMDVNHSTNAFLNALASKDLAQWRGPDLWERCQAVQVSAFKDGSNYERYYMAAKFFIDRLEVRKAIRGDALEPPGK